MSFTEQQLRAIRHTAGPALVLAGPGSGKTAVLTERIRYLVETGAVPPERILVITFTRAAAQEMEQRYRKKAEGAVRFGTFHSVSFSILREKYHYTANNIIRAEEQRRILTEQLSELSLPLSSDEEYLAGLLSEISRYKVWLSGIEAGREEKRCGLPFLTKRRETTGFSFEQLPQEEFLRLFHAYQRELHLRRYLDFDDLLSECRAALVSDPAFLSALRAQYPYLLVDEFQDLSPIQYELLRMLAAPHNNLFIVGDDDQSIYGFRGARPELMLGFPRDFPEAVRIMLSDNFRSRQEIVDYASRLIRKNRSRFEKRLCAAQGRGGEIHTYLLPDTRAEYGLLAAHIQEELAAGIPPEELGVLYRTHRQAAPLAVFLFGQGIPCCWREDGGNVFRHFIGRDLLAYLRLAAGEGGRAELLRILNRPYRGLSGEALRERGAGFPALLEYYAGRPEKERVIHTLLRELKELSELPSGAAICYIRKKIGYEDFLRDFCRERGQEAEPFWELLSELSDFAWQKPKLSDFLHFPEEYETLRQRIHGKERAEGVRLMSYHSAKGLEFRTVYLPDLVEGIAPYRKAKGEKALEEERRCFYVALTRAKERLLIYTVKERNGKSCQISRFLREAAERVCAFPCRKWNAGVNSRNQSERIRGL